MASTYEETRAIINWQQAGMGEIAYIGEEAYSAAKGSAGVLQDDDYGVWIYVNFPDGVFCKYFHRNSNTVTNLTLVVHRSNSDGSTITPTTPAFHS